jgi:protein SCO1/2
MARIPTQYYAAAAVVAIGVLIGGPLAWSALRGPGECGAAVAGADIGGPFTLVDGTGATVTDRDVITGPTLVYFGYSFCPDVCPLDNARNAAATDLLAERGITVSPVFISVDPARDTPEAMAEYTAYMHPTMVGLTGTAEQVAAAADAYRVYYSIGEAADGGDDYPVDHSTFTYLMDPSGLVDFFRRDATPEEVADRVACHVG